MHAPIRRPMSPWEMVRLAEVYDAGGDRQTAAMLLDCAFAAFAVAAELRAVSGHPAALDDAE
jgi:hypothetical protein